MFSYIMCPMIINNFDLRGVSIVSLQTGGTIGDIIEPLVDPKDLTIPALFVKERRSDLDSLILYTEDIRKFSIHQIIVNSYEDIVDYQEIPPINELIELTDQVEELCPVGKYFDVEGVGEGIVWHCDYKGRRYWFKVKGKKHSVSGSSPKVLNPVDLEKLQSVQNLSMKLANVNRVKQAMFESSVDGKIEDLTKSDTPTILKWVCNDIIEEEMDIIVGAGFEWKDIAREVNNTTRRVFFELIEKL